MIPTIAGYAPGIFNIFNIFPSGFKKGTISTNILQWVLGANLVRLFMSGERTQRMPHVHELSDEPLPWFSILPYCSILYPKP